MTDTPQTDPAQADPTRQARRGHPDPAVRALQRHADAYRTEGRETAARLAERVAEGVRESAIRADPSIYTDRDR